MYNSEPNEGIWTTIEKDGLNFILKDIVVSENSTVLASIILSTILAILIALFLTCFSIIVIVKTYAAIVEHVTDMKKYTE